MKHSQADLVALMHCKPRDIRLSIVRNDFDRKSILSLAGLQPILTLSVCNRCLKIVLWREVESAFKIVLNVETQNVQLIFCKANLVL